MQDNSADNLLMQQESNDNFFTSAQFIVQNSEQIVHIVRSLCSIPYILTVDSNDPRVLKSAAVLASCSSSFKLIYERFISRPDYKLMYNLYHEPKLLGYFLATAYDVMRFMGATDLALKNEIQQGKLRSFKINQSIQLLIEICLRGLVFACNDKEKLAISAAECADWVEIWRLLSRYSTYMNLSKVEANFNVQINKEEDLSGCRVPDIEEPSASNNNNENDVSIAAVVAELQNNEIVVTQ